MYDRALKAFWDFDFRKYIKKYKNEVIILQEKKSYAKKVTILYFEKSVI